ncbi:hypothetical protein RMR21_015580 [Agrobacterium sp. rho-8.1]|nr:hypothetical protein [Agrobacterium sp. rho-8.1]
MTVIRITILLSSIMLACAALWMVYSFHVYGVPVEPTDLKNYVERTGLNLIGDGLAGFMALVTLLVVIASFAQQTAQAKQTIKDMKAQNDLNAQIANANYKVMMFDRRVELVSKLNKIADAIVQAGSMEPETRFMFLDAVEHARWIFDGDLLDWLNDLSTKSHAAMALEFRVGRLSKKKQIRGWSATEEDSYTKMLDEQEKIMGEIEAELQPPNLRSKLEGFLMLPPTIITTT